MAETEIDFKKIASEFLKLQDENKRLQSLKERYIKYAETLRDLSKTVAQIAMEIDPVIGSVKTRKSMKREYNDYADEILGKLSAGVQFSRKHIMVTYHLEQYQLNTVIAYMKRKNKKFSQRRENKEVIYFLDGD
jgi:hypothetical protein